MSDTVKFGLPGFGIFSFLTVLLAIGKAAGVFHISWWWVFSPVWLPVLLLAGFSVLACAIIIIIAIIMTIVESKDANLHL